MWTRSSVSLPSEPTDRLEITLPLSDVDVESLLISFSEALLPALLGPTNTMMSFVSSFNFVLSLKVIESIQTFGMMLLVKVFRVRGARKRV